jgi:hypothetical protein
VGRLTEDDYETIKSEIDLRTEQNGEQVSLVMQLEELAGMTLEVFLEDLGMMDYGEKIDKVAVVTGLDTWELFTKTLAKPIGQMMGIEAKHFEPDATKAAWVWAES